MLSKFFKTLLSVFLTITFYSLQATNVYAVCPVCTVAVVGGVGLSRYLGVDDTITGIWIGGLIISSSFWLTNWLSKKQFKIIRKLRSTLITYLSIILMVLFIFIPLWTGKIIGHPYNRILGIDKLIFGSAIGSLVFLIGIWLDKKERKLNGKQLFSFQKVAFPIVSLIIASIVVFLFVRVK